MSMIHYSKPAIVIVILLFVFTTMACSLSTIQFNGDSARVTVKLKEEQVNQLIAQATETQDPLLDEITGVDMLTDKIRVRGTYERPDGGTAEGSYDLSVSAEDGRLKAQIIAIDIEGIELNGAQAQSLNEKISRELEKSYEESSSEVSFESVKVTDEALTIVVNTNWKDK